MSSPFFKRPYTKKAITSASEHISDLLRILQKRAFLSKERMFFKAVILLAEVFQSAYAIIKGKQGYNQL